MQFQRYDVCFPGEKRQLDSEIGALESLQPPAFAIAMRPFIELAPPPELAALDWLNHPRQFTERLTAWLWAQHRIDDYHAAAESYRQALPLPTTQMDAPRWTVVLLGRDALPRGRRCSKNWRRMAPSSPTSIQRAEHRLCWRKLRSEPRIP